MWAGHTTREQVIHSSPQVLNDRGFGRETECGALQAAARTATTTPNYAALISAAAERRSRGLSERDAQERCRIMTTVARCVSNAVPAS